MLNLRLASLMTLFFMTGSSVAFGEFIYVDLNVDGTGVRSTSNGGIVIDGITGAGGWDGTGNNGFAVNWDISFDEVTSLFTYRYTIHGDGFDAMGDPLPLSKALSHLIISLSPTIDWANGGGSFSLLNSDSSGLQGNPTFGEFDPNQGNSNPGMPNSVYGVKFDSSGDPLLFTVAFTTTQAPVWGTFYSKDGKDGGDDTFAYSSGFATSPDFNVFAQVGDDLIGYIPTPDTETGPPDIEIPGVVPEPSSILLFGLGALGMIGYGYRRRKTEMSA